jgi:hypothetical protein
MLGGLFLEGTTPTCYRRSWIARKEITASIPNIQYIHPHPANRRNLLCADHSSTTNLLNPFKVSQTSPRSITARHIRLAPLHLAIHQVKEQPAETPLVTDVAATQSDTYYNQSEHSTSDIINPAAQWLLDDSPKPRRPQLGSSTTTYQLIPGRYPCHTREILHL